MGIRREYQNRTLEKVQGHSRNYKYSGKTGQWKNSKEFKEFKAIREKQEIWKICKFEEVRKFEKTTKSGFLANFGKMQNSKCSRHSPRCGNMCSHIGGTFVIILKPNL